MADKIIQEVLLGTLTNTNTQSSEGSAALMPKITPYFPHYRVSVSLDFLCLHIASHPSGLSVVVLEFSLSQFSSVQLAQSVSDSFV